MARLMAFSLISGLLLVMGLAAPRESTALHAMPCPDMDGDGTVTQDDYDILYSYLGQIVPPAPPQADLHPGPPISDDDVDVQDLQYLAARIGLATSCQDTPIAAKGSPPPPVGGVSRAPLADVLPLGTRDALGALPVVVALAALSLGSAAWLAWQRVRLR